MHCLALSEDKNVFAAGKNWSGQLGVGDANVKYLKQLSPIAAGPWDGHTSMITCGSSFSSFSAILTDDGCIRTFGQYTDHIHPSVWALLSAHVSRWACVVAGSVPSVPKKEEAVAGGHDEGQVRGCNLSVIMVGT